MTQRVRALVFAIGTVGLCTATSVVAGQGQQGNQQPAPPAPPAQDAPPAFEEQVVVTASRVEEQLVNAPAAVSLINSATIQNSPATNIGDLLRSVPGVNVTQVSARDVNVNSRGATSTLATSQLALVDGRSIYLDFYGMVMWDFVPSNPREIKRIEVIRGPASAVWGANAMSGVVNVITKSPRELAAEAGSSLTIGVGGFQRSAQGVDRSAGSVFYVNGSHAQAANDKVAYKISAGYFTQDALPRPVGTINSLGTPYPAYTNEGTSQPKFDARVDYSLADSATLTFNGGVSGTEGIIHTGIGPFDIEQGSFLSYFSAKYQKGARRVAFFTNILTADSTNLISRDTTGAFLPLGFDTKTFDVEAGDSRAIGTHNVLTFGGNYRHNTFDVTLAPGDPRNEGGAFVQDEVFFGRYVRWVVGGRVDKFSSIDGAVFSPRTTLMLKPNASSTFRLSFNKAFRAPSFINNNLHTSVLSEANLSPISPALARFIFPVAAVGNPDLDQESLTAYEVGYTGSLSVLNRRTTVTASVYWNTTKDAIFFTPVTFYGPTNPPPTWPAIIPPFVLGLLPTPLPQSYTYLNLGSVKDKGFELGVEAVATRDINVFANYSYQADPIVDFDPREANAPANNRFNVGFSFSHGRYLGNMDVSYSGSAYWQDVLDLRYAGTTDAYTLVNGAFGVRWAGEKVVTSLKIMNIGNSEVQQHIFGDVLRRQIVGEVRFGF
jgi:iron complex outermembrane receptor protein